MKTKVVQHVERVKLAKVAKVAKVVKVTKVARVKVFQVFQNIPGSQLLSDIQTFFLKHTTTAQKTFLLMKKVYLVLVLGHHTVNIRYPEAAQPPGGSVNPYRILSKSARDVETTTIVLPHLCSSRATSRPARLVFPSVTLTHRPPPPAVSWSISQTAAVRPCQERLAEAASEPAGNARSRPHSSHCRSRSTCRGRRRPGDFDFFIISNGKFITNCLPATGSVLPPSYCRPEWR